MARRILLLITDLEIGGTPTVVRELAIRLNDAANSVHVEVACLSKWGPVADQLRDANVDVTAFDARGSRDLFRTVGRLKKLARERSIDTVFSFLVHANVVAALASFALSDLRFLQSTQTTQPEPRWHWTAQRFAARRADQFVVPSTAIVDHAARRCGIARERFVVIPNALEPADFSPHAVFKNDRIRVGFLGRLDPVKRVDRLIRAMADLRDLPIDCVIYGYGPERGHLEKCVADLQLHDTVTFGGQVKRPRDALDTLDILVLPSKGEGFGLVLIEAMASGVPVIASAHGGVTDVVTDGVNGLLVRDEVANELSSAIRELVEHPDARQRIIENGLQVVRDKFTWQAVLPQYKRVLGISP